MIRYIDMFADQFGVEAICRTLGATAGGFITSRGYRAAKTRQVSDRQIRDTALTSVIERLHSENYGVYGVRKIWQAMRREGWDVGRLDSSDRRNGLIYADFSSCAKRSAGVSQSRLLRGRSLSSLASWLRSLAS